MFLDECNAVYDEEDHKDLFLRFDYEFKDKELALERLRKAGFGKARIDKDLEVRLALFAQVIAPYVKEDDYLSLTLNISRYADLLRYNGPAFRFRAMGRELEYSFKYRLLEVIKAPPMSHRNKNPKQTVIRATPKLRKLLEGLDLQFVMHDPIRLNEKVDGENNRVYAIKIPGRKYKRRLKRYKDTEETKAWRAEIRLINDFLRSIKLEWKDIDKTKSGRYCVFDENGVLVSPVHITRVFARGSFDCYGRCHGFWQNQKKWLRASIKLNGMDTCEPDYSAIHANIAYLEKGLLPPDEPYNIDGFERELVKRTFAILLNAGSLGGAISAVVHKFDISREEAEKVIDAVEEHHAPISDQFHADAGIRLMRIDSDICVSVMLKLVKERIPFLPIHDGFRVPVPHEDRVKEIMIESFQDRYPGFKCKVKS